MTSEKNYFLPSPARRMMFFLQNVFDLSSTYRFKWLFLSLNVKFQYII